MGSGGGQCSVNAFLLGTEWTYLPGVFVHSGGRWRRQVLVTERCANGGIHVWVGDPLVSECFSIELFD